MGAWIHNTALLWFVRETTGSNSWVGAVNMASFLPVLLLVLWSGSLADRLDRRRIILLTQTMMMLGAFALAVSLQMGITSMAVIIPLTAAIGTAFVFNFPAWRALIPDLVSREQMLNGIALDAAQFNLARSVGPLLGALILNAWGAEAAFHINAASFLAVILALLAMRTRTPAAAVSGRTGKHIGEGMRTAFGESWSRNLLVLLAIFSFFGLSFLVLLPGMSREVLGRGSGGYGALLSVIGAGAVAGAPLVSALRRLMQEKTIIKATALVFGLSLTATAFCREFWICLLLAFCIGTSSLMLSAVINTVLQARVEREMRGRIMSLYILVFQGIYPLGGHVPGLPRGHDLDSRDANGRWRGMYGGRPGGGSLPVFSAGGLFGAGGGCPGKRRAGMTVHMGIYDPLPVQAARTLACRRHLFRHADNRFMLS